MWKEAGREERETRLVFDMGKEPAEAGDDEGDISPALPVKVVELLAIDEVGLRKGEGEKKRGRGEREKVSTTVQECARATAC